MTLLLACWRWLTAPRRGMDASAARRLRARAATKHVATQHPVPLAPIHAPLSRLLI